MYKVSKYFIAIEDGNKIIVFNTMTTSIIKMDKDMYFNIFVENEIPDNVEIRQSLINMGYIIDEAIDENFRLELLRRKYKYIDRGITSAVIAVTTECNARCYYCYENGIERDSMSEDTADKIIDFLDKNSKSRELTIQWFGGEPLCAVNIIDRITCGLRDRGVNITSLITTNGYCINEEILSKAKKLWNVKRFQIPIDAIGEEYNRIKNYIGIKGNDTPFDIVVKNIHSALEMGFHVNVRTNFNPKNIEPTKKVLNYLAYEFRGESRFFVYPEPITGVGMASVVDASFSNKLHPYFELLVEARKLGFLSPTLLKEDRYFGGDESLSGIKLTSRPMGCYATLLNTIAIDPKGVFYKCHRLIGRGDKYSCGDVFKGIMLNSNLKKFCDDTFCYEECFECKLLPICQGGCKVKKEFYGGHNACIAIKNIVHDLVRVYAQELNK